MASSSDSEDDSFMAVDQEETVLEGTMEQDEEPRAALEVAETQHNRSMSELPEEVLEYILSFLSPQPPATATVWVCTCCATERGTARVLGRGDPVASAQRGAFPQSSWKSFVYRQRPSLQSL